MHTFKNRSFLAAIALLCAGAGTALAADVNDPKIEPDVVYGHKDGLAMTMDVFKPASGASGAAVIFMVSGGWYSSWSPPERLVPLFQPFLDHGYTMIAVRHGSSPRYSIPEAVADVRQSVRFIRLNAERFGVDSERLGVMGMSAGGHLSLMLGTTGDDGVADTEGGLDQVSSRVAAVVALVPPTDLRVAVWESPESLPAYRNFPALDLSMNKAEENSPLVHVSSDDAPALVIMGGKDDLVPEKHGHWIDEAYDKAQVECRLIVFPDAGHGLEGAENQSTRIRESIKWFDKYLSVKK